MEGKVKVYFPDRNYGFISGDDDKSYFYHKDDCPDKIPSPADRVSFTPTGSSKGNRACVVKIITT